MTFEIWAADGTKFEFCLFNSFEHWPFVSERGGTWNNAWLFQEPD